METRGILDHGLKRLSGGDKAGGAEHALPVSRRSRPRCLGSRPERRSVEAVGALEIGISASVAGSVLHLLGIIEHRRLAFVVITRTACDHVLRVVEGVRI